MSLSSPAAALLGELDALHRGTVFPEKFQKLNWSMVAAYECELSRKGGKIHVHKTTFWMSSDKDPNGEATIEFRARSGAMGAHITHPAFTEACQTQGDISIVIGFTPTKEQARAADREHRNSGRRSVVFDKLTDRDTAPHGARSV